MGLYIDDLEISYSAKNILHELGFTMVSDLEGHDYISLIQKFPLKRHYVAAIIQELNSVGYLLPPENAVTIYDVSMSQRLLHILERNYILYLSQLSLCSKEELARMRNLGEQTMIELEELCKAQDIELRSVQNIKENLAPYQLPFRPIHYEGLYKYKITAFDELNKLTTHDLHMICQRNYTDTMKMYFILKDKGIIFQEWEDKYLFEVMPRKDAQTLDRKYRIYTVSQLCACAEILIVGMPASILPSVKSVNMNIYHIYLFCNLKHNLHNSSFIITYKYLGNYHKIFSFMLCDSI